MNRLASLTLALASAMVVLPADAQFAKPEDAIKYRQSAMIIQAAHFGRVAAMANGRVPYDQASAVANAEIVAMMSQRPWAAYGPGTQGGHAKPEIWTEQAKFQDYSDKLMADTAKLVVAAKAGNIDALKAAVGPVGGTCKACHDAFRKD